MLLVSKIVPLALLIALVSSCGISKIPTVDSYKTMPFRQISKAENKSFLEKELTDLSTIQVKKRIGKTTLPSFLEESSSSAFLVLQKGKIIFEWYAEDFEAEQAHSSFSMAKSIHSALVGIAIEEGKITSVEDKVTQYLPQLDTNDYGNISIKHLLQMTSGIRYSELDVFYSQDETAIFEEDRVRFKAGKRFEYWSATTQLLGLALQQAIAPQSISEYLSEKIWKPMGAEQTASWSTDKEGGVEKTFCCIQAIARDYARFGLIYLNEGNFNGQQIVPKAWITESIALNEEEGSTLKYNYGWWFLSPNKSEYLARGFRGQYLFMNPEKETLIVRLGDGIYGKLGKKWAKIFSGINEQLK